MKPEECNRFGWMGQRDSRLERLEAPEIVGEVENPLLEAVRRFWWRTLDRICSCFMSFRLWLFDRIHGAESTPVDLQRKADQ